MTMMNVHVEMNLYYRVVFISLFAYAVHTYETDVRLESRIDGSDMVISCLMPKNIYMGHYKLHWLLRSTQGIITTCRPICGPQCLSPTVKSKKWRDDHKFEKIPGGASLRIIQVKNRKEDEEFICGFYNASNFSTEIGFSVKSLYKTLHAGNGDVKLESRMDGSDMVINCLMPENIYTGRHRLHWMFRSNQGIITTCRPATKRPCLPPSVRSQKWKNEHKFEKIPGGASLRIIQVKTRIEDEEFICGFYNGSDFSRDISFSVKYLYKTLQAGNGDKGTPSTPYSNITSQDFEAETKECTNEIRDDVSLNSNSSTIVLAVLFVISVCIIKGIAVFVCWLYKRRNNGSFIHHVLAKSLKGYIDKLEDVKGEERLSGDEDVKGEERLSGDEDVKGEERLSGDGMDDEYVHDASNKRKRQSYTEVSAGNKNNTDEEVAMEDLQNGNGNGETSDNGGRKSSITVHVPDNLQNGNGNGETPENDLQNGNGNGETPDNGGRKSSITVHVPDRVRKSSIAVHVPDRRRKSSITVHVPDRRRKSSITVHVPDRRRKSSITVHVPDREIESTSDALDTNRESESTSNALDAKNLQNGNGNGETPENDLQNGNGNGEPPEDERKTEARNFLMRVHSSRRKQNFQKGLNKDTEDSGAKICNSNVDTSEQPDDTVGLLVKPKHDEDS